MMKKIKTAPISTKEALFQLALHLVVFIFYSFDKYHPQFESYKVLFFLNYAFAAFVINYFLLPRFYYQKKYLPFFGFVLLAITAVILIEELALEPIYFPGRRADTFPGVLFTLVQVLPVITMGIDFLKTMANPPHVILTTAFPDYALESYEFNVVDYLLKPFSFQRFVKAVSRVPAKSHKEQEQGTIGISPQARREFFIKSGYEHIKITVDEIIYIQSDADYTEIFTPGKKYLSSEPLRYWEENLDNRQFARVHKSYIINISKIEKIVGNQICLIEGKTVPIGRAYKDGLIEKFIR